MIAVFKPAPMPISIDRYERMAAAGVLRRDDRVARIAVRELFASSRGVSQRS